MLELLGFDAARDTFLFEGTPPNPGHGTAVMSVLVAPRGTKLAGKGDVLLAKTERIVDAFGALAADGRNVILSRQMGRDLTGDESATPADVQEMFDEFKRKTDDYTKTTGEE